MAPQRSDDRDGAGPPTFSVCWDEEPTETEPPMTMDELLRLSRERGTTNQ